MDSFSSIAGTEDSTCTTHSAKGTEEGGDCDTDWRLAAPRAGHSHMTAVRDIADTLRQAPLPTASASNPTYLTAGFHTAGLHRFMKSPPPIPKRKIETNKQNNHQQQQNKTKNKQNHGKKDNKIDTVFDLVILQAKQFIYKFKLDKWSSTLSCFLQQLMMKYKLEEINSYICGWTVYH